MNVQGFQKMTLLDYPGRVAATVFCGGCDLRCPFCHNASLVKTPCENPSQEEEVLAYLEKRKGLLDGVCITGGEPLLQKDLPAFLKKVKAMGYAVKLDTNGTQPERLREILESGLVDMVAMDVKSALRGYEKATGVAGDVSRFERSIAILKQSSVTREFRTTLVKGIHDKELVREAAALVGDEPYFLQSFKDSGDTLAEGCEAFGKEELNALWEEAKKEAPRAMLRGVE